MPVGRYAGWPTTKHKNMYANKTLKNLYCIAPAFVLGALLGGCNDEDHSKPNLNDVKAVVQDQFGDCPLWTVRDIRRVDGMPIQKPGQAFYGVKSSFILAIKDADAINVAARNNFKAPENCNLQVIMQLVELGPFDEQQPPNAKLAARYQVDEADAFVRSEQGWHLPNIERASIHTFTPLPDSDSGASASDTSAEGATVKNDGGSENEQAQPRSIFHRLNLLVMSLFHIGDSHTNDSATASSPTVDTASAGTTPIAASGAAVQEASDAAVADAASTVVPADVSNAAAAIAASVTAASLAAETPPAASLVAVPAVVASSVLPAQGSAASNQTTLATQVQMAKLQLLVQKAQAELDSARYGSAVATAEAILLLDPANTQAQQLRARALRFAQKPTPVLAAKEPLVQTAALPTPAEFPSPQPVARPLAVADLEGDWRGIYQCGSYAGSGSVSDPDAWTRHVTMTVRNGRVTLVRQSEENHAFREVLLGDIAADLSLHLAGTGQNAESKHPWSGDFAGRFAGTMQQATFQADGALSNWRGERFRACRLSLSR